MAPRRDPYEHMRFNMVRAHATFKLGYDVILKQLENPPMDDIVNFLGYCQAWAVSIDAHHDTEEAVVFPFLNQKLDFSGEIEQHKEIHAALDDILDFIGQAQADVSKFDNAKLKEMMSNLRESLFQHLDEEVEHIAPEKLKVFKEEEMSKLNRDLEAYAKSHGDPWLAVPYMVSHTSPEFKEEWPGLPWILRKVLVPYVFAQRYSGYWKYSPYQMS